jgi:hypothetical protein
LVTPHVRVNGAKNIGGDVAWTLYQLQGKRWVRRGSGAVGMSEGLEAGEEAGGTYRLSARFLGDENLYPSSRWATTTYRVRGRC